MSQHLLLRFSEIDVRRYGVSRVYLQQCGYVLADAQTAHNTMMLMLRTVENNALDSDAGKAR